MVKFTFENRDFRKLSFNILGYKLVLEKLFRLRYNFYMPSRPSITDPLLNVSEAATSLGISEVLMRRYCEQGRIKARKLGRAWMIRQSALNAFKLQERRPGRPSIQALKEIENASESLPAIPIEVWAAETRDKSMLSLLAAGLIQVRDSVQRPLTHKHTEPGYVASPHPPALILGWSYLSAAFIEHGRILEQPIGVDELYAWCAKPLTQWPLSDTFRNKFDIDNTLIRPELADDVTNGLTTLCEEWARAGIDVRSEFDEERIMPEIQRLCRAHKESGQQLYTRIRKLFISHPVISETDLSDLYADLPEALGALLVGDEGAYTELPISLALKGQFYVCPYCGLILHREDGLQPSGSTDCRDRRCQQKRRRQPITVPAKEKVYRLANGLRRYVSAPGKAELNLAQRLKELGFDVELWPEFDAYDLRLFFPKQSEVWAIDVKDWNNPVALGLNIAISDRPAFAEYPKWNRAFFVFPDDLRSRRPFYVSDFKRECEDKLWSERGRYIDAMFMRDFLLECNSPLEKVR